MLERIGVENIQLSMPLQSEKYFTYFNIDLIKQAAAVVQLSIMTQKIQVFYLFMKGVIGAYMNTIAHLKYHKKSVCTLAGCAVGFVLIALELKRNQLNLLDAVSYNGLSHLISSDLTEIMKIITSLGSTYIMCGVTAILIGVLGIKLKKWFYGISVALNLIVVSFLNLLLKSIFLRPRPDILQLVYASGYSFPSGHAMVGIAFYGFLIYLCSCFLKSPWHQVLTVLLVALILLIGISRIYLGVHYASDIMGGFLAGLTWLMIFIISIEARECRKNGSKKEEVHIKQNTKL